MQWVDRQLRYAILNGELEPGEKLNTEELARQWSVSPTPLRETYQRLAADGLVDLIPQRGARVAELSMAEALDIYSVRQLLEPYALRVSLERADEAWQGEITAAFQPLREELENPGDLHSLESAHQEFHLELLSRCGSTWLLRIIRMLQDHSMRYRLLSLGPRGGLGEVLHEHEELLEACLAEDVEAATDRLAAHLQLTIDSISTEIDRPPHPDEDGEAREEDPL